VAELAALAELAEMADQGGGARTEEKARGGRRENVGSEGRCVAVQLAFSGETRETVLSLQPAEMSRWLSPVTIQKNIEHPQDRVGTGRLFRLFSVRSKV